MELLVVLLYTAGLRIGEVVRLQIRDYDAREATLLIRETKFAKTRLVALSASAQRVLDTYLIRRRRLRLSCAPSDPLRCCPVNHVPSVGGAADGLTLLMRHCGLKPARGRQGPRVHDLRHSFAMERVLQWYREGRDVQVLLPRLVTYMGHRSLESTQHYLTVTPEVLRVASGRFETYAAGRPQRVQS
jgi:integrase